MRSFRQILHGCKKHHLVLFREARWYEDEYKKGARSLWLCKNCWTFKYLPVRVK